MGRTKKRRLNKDRVLGVGIILVEIILGIILICITNSSPQTNSSTMGSTITETEETTASTTTTVTTKYVTTTTTIVKPKVYFVPYEPEKKKDETKYKFNFIIM